MHEIHGMTVAMHRLIPCVRLKCATWIYNRDHHTVSFPTFSLAFLLAFIFFFWYRMLVHSIALYIVHIVHISRYKFSLFRCWLWNRYTYKHIIWGQSFALGSLRMCHAAFPSFVSDATVPLLCALHNVFTTHFNANSHTIYKIYILLGLNFQARQAYTHTHTQQGTEWDERQILGHYLKMWSRTFHALKWCRVRTK